MYELFRVEMSSSIVIMKINVKISKIIQVN